MKFLHEMLLEMFLDLGLNEKMANVISFFLFEITYLSIILLIGLVVFTFIRVKYLGEDFAERLKKKPKAVVYLGMALLGVVSPFCSCSTIPVFISFSTLGIPTGALFVFLITSPMVQEASLILLLTHFGIPISLMYVGLGVLTGIVTGLIIATAKDEELFHDNVLMKRSGDSCSCECVEESGGCCGEAVEIIDPNKEPFKYALNNAVETYKSMFKFIVVGIGIGAFVYGVVPNNVIENLLGTKNTLAPIFATLVGIPTYADDVALIPVAKTLVDGGAGLGTALAFVMASSIVSVPSFIMLSSALKKKTIAKLVIYLIIAIIIIGYIFNFFAPYTGI